MKILYLLFSFTTGGTERLVTDICNQMVKKGNEVYLYVVNDLYSEEMLTTLSEKVNVVLQKRQVGGNKIATLSKIYKFIKQHNIDVVHCNSFHAPELLLFSAVLDRKVKIVHTIHDVGQYKTLNKWKRWYRNRVCHTFVAISESVKQDMISYGADADKISVVYNAIDLKKYGEIRNKEFSKNAIVLGNVARIDVKKKGQDLLLEAVAMLRKQDYQVECFFAGAADAAHQGDLELLKQKSDELGIGKWVHFLGNVNDIPGFLKGIDIFVLPSRFEGFGISLIEAMAMGIPCVACDLYGPAEIIGNDERGLLFQTGNSRDLFVKLDKMINEYESVQKNILSNVEYVHTHFDIVNMCEALSRIYSQ